MIKLKYVKRNYPASAVASASAATSLNASGLVADRSSRDMENRIASPIVGTTLSGFGSYWGNGWEFHNRSTPQKTIWQMLNRNEHEQVRFNNHRKPDEPPHYHAKSLVYEVKIFIHPENRPEKEEFAVKAFELKKRINGIRKTLEKRDKK